MPLAAPGDDREVGLGDGGATGAVVRRRRGPTRRVVGGEEETARPVSGRGVTRAVLRIGRVGCRGRSRVALPFVPGRTRGRARRGARRRAGDAGQRRRRRAVGGRRALRAGRGRGRGRCRDRRQDSGEKGDGQNRCVRAEAGCEFGQPDPQGFLHLRSGLTQGEAFLPPPAQVVPSSLKRFILRSRSAHPLIAIRSPVVQRSPRSSRSEAAATSMRSGRDAI